MRYIFGIHLLSYMCTGFSSQKGAKRDKNVCVGGGGETNKMKGSGFAMSKLTNII